MRPRAWYGLAAVAVLGAVACVLPEVEVDRSLDEVLDAGVGGTGGNGVSGAGVGGSGVGGTGGSGGTDASAGTSGSAGVAGGAAGVAGAGAGGGSAGGGGCPGTGGPAMVMLPQGYCIDSTEVTRAHYQAWLDTVPSTEGQHALCSAWNSTYAPGATCMTGSDVCQGPGCANHPQVCVDWCDAFAYCTAVGKRLCGSIEGGANGWSDYADASKDQWYNACSSGGVHNYPYGGDPGVSTTDGYDGLVCNGDEMPSGSTLVVGSSAGCQSKESGYTGVFDLSGNVWEWADCCNGTDGQQDSCAMRGGAYNYSGDSMRCGIGANDYRGTMNYDIGFRCCGP